MGRFSIPSILMATIILVGCDESTGLSPESPPEAALEVLGAPAAFWPFGGQNLSNTRNASRGIQINSGNVSNLAPRWVTTTGGDVSATPSVDATSVYFPDWAGNVYSLDRRTGAVNWSRQVGDYTGVTGDFSLVTPAQFRDLLIFGDQGGRSLQGARLIAVEKRSGDLRWTTNLDTHPTAIVTQSPVVFKGTVFVGVSSFEDSHAVIPGYPCCTFRGSMVALDASTGQILWKTFMAPDVPGYSGNSVSGPTAAVDPRRGSVFITTGHNYSVPDGVLDCVAANEGDPDAVAACSNPSNYFDAVVSLDIQTGAVKWASRTLPFDAWTWACPVDPTSVACPSPAGLGQGFGEGAALFKVSGSSGIPMDLVGAGQKSGQYWTFDRDTGGVVWVTNAGPGSTLGGMIWGSAADGDRIYTANANGAFQDWYLLGGGMVNYGFWTAMDASTGEILWQTADPSGGWNQGPVTVARDVVFTCSLKASGTMYALDSATGQLLWSFDSGGSCAAGPAVVDGMVYWGSGYSALSSLGATGNNNFYAFEVQE
jgi:polyvinyl alcohol dehydrogenase (cytochrome)